MNQKRNKKIILHIDPNPKVTDLMENAPTRYNLNIVRVSSGKEGLDMIKEIHPDLIISEFQTTDLDGKSLLRLFTAETEFVEYRHIPILFFSNQEMRLKYSKECFDLGLVG